MERALALERIRAALADAQGLPSPESLATLLADLEVALFLRTSELSPDVLRAGWYLHGIAQADGFEALYPKTRRLAAWQVSAHIFDLALAQSDTASSTRLRHAFAAQLGYLRGELHPNAVAIYGRVRNELTADSERIDATALSLGIAFLGMNRRAFYDMLTAIEKNLANLKQYTGLSDLKRTRYQSLDQLTHACRLMMRFLLRGDATALGLAETALGLAVSADGAERFLDARWVAANLRKVAPQFGSESVWAVMPPGTPDAVMRSFVFGQPSVLTLWPPQIELIRANGSRSPLEASVRRLVLSVPTSGGKTLVSQLLAMSHLSSGTGSVCFVVPTRSLARELRTSLAERLRLYRRSIGADVPDWFGLSQDSHVDVMTPERLSLLLRQDVDAVLRKYGLFIFDEVHTLADSSRGLTTESCIGLIHNLTRHSSHRLMVMSAAIGNRQQVAQWLDPLKEGLAASSEWRGPRRLLGVYPLVLTGRTRPQNR